MNNIFSTYSKFIFISKLLIGDPTLFGNFKPCDEILDAMLTTVNSSKFNGYQPASGNEEARKAVAEYCSSYGMNVEAKVGKTLIN